VPRGVECWHLHHRSSASLASGLAGRFSLWFSRHPRLRSRPMTLTSLRALCMALWQLLAPGAEKFPTAPGIADAIAHAVEHHADPERWAAVMSLYAFRESSLRPGVIGDSGQSCGAWQLPCAAVRGKTLAAQAALWLGYVDASSLGSVDSSPSRAAKRERHALALLAQVNAQGATELQR
jgi:hypothetical protein